MPKGIYFSLHAAFNLNLKSRQVYRLGMYLLLFLQLTHVLDVCTVADPGGPEARDPCPC